MATPKPGTKARTYSAATDGILCSQDGQLTEQFRRVLTVLLRAAETLRSVGSDEAGTPADRSGSWPRSALIGTHRQVFRTPPSPFPDAANDFGEDLLRKHYEEHHADAK